MLTKDRLSRMGLREGVIRCREEVHNGGWYNTLGEKLGWGDLTWKISRTSRQTSKTGSCLLS